MQEVFKQTEIGIIPKDWNVVTLADVCSKNGIVRGPFGGALKKEIFVSEGYKVYEQGNAIYRSITRGKYYIDSNKYNEMLRFAVNVDDFIVSCSGTIGMIYKIPKNAPKGIINQALLKLSIDRSVVDSNYFYLYFSWEEFNNRITDDTQGGAIKNLVSMELFKKTWLLLPSLTEQEHIAEALSDVDSMIFSLEKLIAKKKAVKDGAMQELLTGKKRLHGFDGEWVEKKIEDFVVRFATGLNPRQNFKLNNGGTNYYVTIKDFREGKLFLDDACDRIDNAALERINERSDLKKNDLLFSSIGRIGDAYLITETPKNWNINESVFALRPNQQIVSPLMLYYLLTSEDVKNKLLDSTTGSTLKSIKLGHLKEITCRFPKVIEEQIAIASILSDMDNEIEALEQKLEKTRQIKQGMMQQLLTGKIRLV